MTIARSTLNIGPGIITFDSQVIYSKDDIIVTPVIETFDVETSMFGKADERLDNIMFEVTFTPAGQWTAGHLPVLWPYTNPIVGSSVFGTDKNVVINGLNGQQMSFYAGAITSMPSIRLSAKESVMGQVTMMCIGADDTAWTDAAKRATVAAVAFSDTSFVSSAIKTVAYTSTWGASAPWDDFSTEDGWTIDFEVDMVDISVDTEGIVDKRIGPAITGVIAKCVPQGVTEAQLLSLLKVQGAGIVRGASLSGNTNDLVITGGVGNPLITLNHAAPKEGPFRWGSTQIRSGEIAFVSVAEFTAGARHALFSVAVGS